PPECMITECGQRSLLNAFNTWASFWNRSEWGLRVSKRKWTVRILRWNQASPDCFRSMPRRRRPLQCLPNPIRLVGRCYWGRLYALHSLTQAGESTSSFHSALRDYTKYDTQTG